MSPAVDAQEDHNLIIVTGDKQRKKKIHNFIKSAVKIAKDSQYTRFQYPVCPVAMGFNEEMNNVIEQRMRDVIKFAEIRLNGKGCKPNMALVAIKGPQGFVKELRGKYAGTFGEMSIPQRDRLTRGPGPTYAWNVSYAQCSGGSGASGTGTDNKLDGLGQSGDAKNCSSANSRLKMSTQQAMQMSVVVVDKERLQDCTLRQVADYAVMRLLANTKDPKRTDLSERSILTLFSEADDGFEIPESVTAWDVALLKSLYSTASDVTANRQRANMARIFDLKLLEVAQASDDTDRN